MLRETGKAPLQRRGVPARLGRMTDADYDLCVIGGGINGAGIARDAAGRGLSVLLVEARDLACATSSASTKLIHGGLRYLEFFQFRLVRDSLREREILLNAAPHIVRPLDFILPHSPRQRPFWTIRLGLSLYDRLARRNRLPASHALEFAGHPAGAPLAPEYKRGFCYADCAVDDSRLVVLNAVDAAGRGAEILTRTKCVGITPRDKGWALDLRDEAGQIRTVSAAMVANAAGPWVRDVMQEISSPASGSRPVPGLRLVKGSHIIIPRAYDGDRAYVLQQTDRRIVFAIPYAGDYTLVGTTEEEFSGDPAAVMISDGEIEYLCAAFNAYFDTKISRSDAAWSYSGVRALLDDGAGEARKVTRDFLLHEHAGAKAPMISVFGGKLTTYRLLAERVVDRLLRMDNRYAAPWTAGAVLPGGDFSGGGIEAFVQDRAAEYSWLPRDILLRYAHAYGTRIDRFLEGARSLADLGVHFGGGLYEAEAAYMVRYEFAREAEDVLWRRSKLGMALSDEEAAKLRRRFPAILKEACP